MEHRWGERVGVDVAVRITSNHFTVRHGNLVNLSVSGALVAADLDVRPLSRIQLVLELPRKARSEAPCIDAYVTRHSKAGIGIEWCEFAPPPISELLRTYSARRYMRVRRAELASPITIPRFYAPLLKHGT